MFNKLNEADKVIQTAMSKRFSALEQGIPLAELEVRGAKLPLMEDPLNGYREKMGSVVAGVTPGTLVLDKRFMPGLSDRIASAELIEVPDHARTREASRHQLIFGQLLLQSMDEGEGSLHVAAKTLPDPVLTHEYGMTGHVSAGLMNNCDTYRPVGIARMYDGQAAMLTVYRHPVRSLDNIFANPALIDEAEVIDKALRRAAVALATPHAAGWVQVDTQTKNVAWDLAIKDPDHTFLIDLETTEYIGHQDQAVQDDRKAGDIRTFVASTYELEDKGCEMPEDFELRLSKVFGGAYAARLKNLGAEYQTEIDQEFVDGIIGKAPRIRHGEVVDTAA